MSLKKINNTNWKAMLEQKKFLAFLIASILLIIVVFMNFAKTPKTKELAHNNIAIKFPENITKGDKVWQEYLEEKISTMGESLDQKNTESIKEFNSKLEEIVANQKNMIESMQSQINEQSQYIQTMNENKENNTQTDNSPSRDFAIMPIGQTSDVTKKPELPKDIGIYIPASTYVEGRLLSGISVSTGVNIQSDPQPIIIRITDNAKLPGGHLSKLKNCRIVGSSYGDISSERAIIRIENLVCVNDETKQSIETKVAGFVVGDDGIAGIRGTVVSMDYKHMGYAALGGVVGGLSKGMKNSASVAYNPTLGLIEEKQSLKDKLQNNTLAGVGDTGSKIADYYIKKAESISPVIQVPSGVRVDVVFTEGVYFGQLNTKEMINQDRVKNSGNNFNNISSNNDSK